MYMYTYMYVLLTDVLNTQVCLCQGSKTLGEGSLSLKPLSTQEFLGCRIELKSSSGAVWYLYFVCLSLSFAYVNLVHYSLALYPGSLSFLVHTLHVQNYSCYFLLRKGHFICVHFIFICALCIKIPVPGR